MDENKSGVYDVLAFVLIGKDAAKKALKNILDSSDLDGFKIIAKATVSKDEKDKLHIHEPGKGVKGAKIGAATGGVLALLGGPVGLLAMMAGGAAVGGAVGHFDKVISKGDLKELGDALTPDTSAFLLLLEDTYSEGVIGSLP